MKTNFKVIGLIRFGIELALTAAESDGTSPHNNLHQNTALILQDFNFFPSIDKNLYCSKFYVDKAAAEGTRFFSRAINITKSVHNPSTIQTSLAILKQPHINYI